MRNAFYTLLTLIWMVSIFSTTLYSQGTQDNDKIWSKVFIDQNSIDPGDPNYKWDAPAPQTKIFLFGGTGITVNPNFRPFPTTNSTQSEMSVDVAPFNEQIVFASANTTPWPVTTVWGTGVYWSLDGGQSWGGADNPASIPGFGSNGGDPVSVIGNNGYFYEGYISNPGGQGISVSTDNGVTWTSHTVAPNPGSLADKNHMMVDKTPGSPYEDRIYVAWTDFGGANNRDVVVRYSTNNGTTWSSSINLSNSLGGYLHQGVNIQTGPNGEVYCTWIIYNDSNVSNGEDRVGFSVSTDGGVTWTTSEAYSATNFGIRGFLNFGGNIRVSSFPSMAVDRTNGNIYITWPQRGVAPAGSDPDIVMIKSNDGGTTWTSPVLVNDDQSFNQYFPWCTVDQSTGQLLFVFYDSRNTGNDSTSVWMASSFDGGTTFNNFEVSEEPFKPKTIAGLSGNYQGDYIGIAALNDVAYPYWMDDRTGTYQGWMSVVNFGPPCPIDPPTSPDPATGATDVPITLTQLSWTNGAGANENELWYGEAGSMALVHSGSLISSWAIPGTLPYSTSYQWRVVEMNDTCSVSGPVWSFTTEADPNIVALFFEPFTDLTCWTPIGPLGLTNWSLVNSNNANGGAPELEFHWSPSFDGLSQLLSCTINAPDDTELFFSLKHFLDWFSNPAPTLGLAVTYDGGSTSTTYWQFQPTGNVGPEIVEFSFTTPLSGSQNMQLILFNDGNSFNIDDWYVDDILIEYVVPVELTSFAAVTVDDNVQLNWSTATEINNQGFEIQRRTGDGEFEKVGFVPGHGTTTDIQNYSYFDSKVATGNYDYRLKQIDFNGAFEYSDAVEVEVTAPLEFTLEQNYPNPFNPSTSIKYSIPENGFVTLDVYNLLGEKVASLVNGVQEAGRYEVNFDASHLASGIYVYNLKSGSFNSVKKMLLMK